MKYGTLFFALTLALMSCQKNYNTNKELVNLEVPVFQALKAKGPITVDGKMLEEEWHETPSSSFNNYYRFKKDGDKQKSTFRALWDETNLYFFYAFEDKYLTVRETQRDGKPYFDDCAELFLIPVPEALDTHFCFEINLNKAANDLIYFNNYYQGNSIALKPFNPEYKVEITYDGTINDNSDIDKGWTMELEIPLTTFGFLANFEPVREGNKWMFLAIRQERNELEGERRITSTIFPIADFDEDVHQPHEFGYLEFIN